MPKDLKEYGPEGARPKPSAKRKFMQMVIFGALLALTLVWLPVFYYKMAPSTARTIILVLLVANGIAAMVNLYRTFRPHKT